MSWLVGSLLVAAVVFAPAVVSGQVTRSQAAGWSASDCQDCHDKAVSPAYANSAHAKVDRSCASCHKNVAEHLKAQQDGKEGPVPTLKGLKANDLSQTCLSCHEKSNQATFVGSKHARRNVSCTSCHSIHSPKSLTGQLKTKSEVETCFSCHKTERAKSLRTSHHPVREGKMACTSCHNPHEGTRPKMIKAESVRELCYQCHAEKRGPFLFEHAPVREDCVACHDVHGSNHPRTGEVSYSPNARIALGAYYTSEKDATDNRWSTTTGANLNNRLQYAASNETGTFGANMVFQLVPDKHTFTVNAVRQKVDGLLDIRAREAGSFYTPGRTGLIPAGQGGAADITDWDDTEITTISTRFDFALMKGWTMSTGYLYEKYDFKDAMNSSGLLMSAHVYIFLKPNDGAYENAVAFAQLSFKC